MNRPRQLCENIPMAAKKPRRHGGEELYRMVFEQARDSMLVLELPETGSPRILDANPAALVLHGFSRESLVNSPVGVLGASLSRGRFRSSSPSGVFEVRHERPGGEPLVTEVTARNVKADGGHYGILIERDVTWRRRLEEEGRVLSCRLMQDREADKKRLAAGLHDSLGALQVGLSAELLLLEECVRRGEKRKALAGLERARKVLRESCAELKKSCIEGWPPSLAVSGLGAALSELVSAFARRSGIRVKRSIKLRNDAALSAGPAAIVLYRLAQEALANAERHSGASRLDFSVSREKDWLALEVRDYGRGFDPAADCGRSDCLGLKIMADAAETAGGYFSVYSVPGKGARVKAQLPLAPAPKAAARG